MPSHKNQHYVPRCYLRAFTTDEANKSINLFNIDRMRFIENAPVKNQCSKDYFYGKDLVLEELLQATEGIYSTVLREILSPGFKMTDSHSKFIKRFWLLQFMRTDAASRRGVEIVHSMTESMGITPSEYRMKMKDAVQTAMKAFADNMEIIDDLKVCLVKNNSTMPFVTSDDPAVLTNRWYFLDKRTRGMTFGLRSAGNLILLPLSPFVLCLGYDRDVYSLPHKNGWIKVRNDNDVKAINQHQYLNCWANIFTHNSRFSQNIQNDFQAAKPYRPTARHIMHHAIPDQVNKEYTRYRVIEPPIPGEHRRVLVHIQTLRAEPTNWPLQLGWRTNGFVFSNGTGIGYIRQAHVHDDSYRKVLARKRKH